MRNFTIEDDNYWSPLRVSKHQQNPCILSAIPQKHRRKLLRSHGMLLCTWLEAGRLLNSKSHLRYESRLGNFGPVTLSQPMKPVGQFVSKTMDQPLVNLEKENGLCTCEKSSSKKKNKVKIKISKGFCCHFISSCQ